MTKNKIKLIAAVTMLIDHIGIILFPEIPILRLIGRLSFPLFAFCIGDGCLHTKQPNKYFFRILGLGIGCQLFFAIEELLISKVPFPGEVLYFNVLFTFSLSVLLCLRWVALKKENTPKNTVLFCITLFGIIGLDLLCQALSSKYDARILFDYKAAGAILPLFAVLKENRRERTAVYAVGTCLLALINYSSVYFILFTLLALPILYFYNEKPGRKGFKYGFYLFYPLQFAILYFIKSIFFS